MSSFFFTDIARKKKAAESGDKPRSQAFPAQVKVRKKQGMPENEANLLARSCGEGLGTKLSGNGMQYACSIIIS